MFGFTYLKTAPTTYVIQYKAGKVVREGAGLSFIHFAPTSTIVHVPLASTDLPFVFTEVTSDFQEVTIQGQLTYRTTDAKRLAALLDLSVDWRGRDREDHHLEAAGAAGDGINKKARCYEEYGLRGFVPSWLI